MPLEHPIPFNLLLYSWCNFGVIFALPSLSASVPGSVIKYPHSWLIFVVHGLFWCYWLVWTYLALFACWCVLYYVDHLFSGSLHSVAVGIYSLASLIVLVHFLALLGNCINIDALVNYYSLVSNHLWYTWVIIGAQHYSSVCKLV